MKHKTRKVIETIKKHDNIFILILIILSIFGVSLNILIAESDELWNFQSVYKMYNGFQIYKDFNVIITPLFFIIGKILFNIFGANFLTFRIYNIIITTALYFTTYLLLKSIGINKKNSAIITLILIIFKRYLMVRAQANYTTMALMLCIIGILFCIKKNKYNTIIQGIIIFLIFYTKQNIGVYYGTSLFLFEILSKNNIKEKIKRLLIEFITFITLLILSLIIFYMNNNLYDFINYAFLGIKEFANENIFIAPDSMITIIFFIIINLTFTIIYIKNKKIGISENEKENLITLNCFAIPLLLISWPIVNDVHSIIAIHISIILFVYIINIMMKRINIKISKKIINGILVFLCVISCGFSIVNFYSWIINKNYIKEKYSINEESPYYGGVIEEERIENINAVVNYIQSRPNNVIVLSYKAALYMIPLQRNNGDMDLPFKGNLGRDGENGIIEKLKKMENVEILITKDKEDKIWQESELVRNYIKDNMVNIGEIEEFEIWKK